MSDDDDDYGFEYSDDEQVEEGEVDIENQYYNSKGQLDGGDQGEALRGFQEVVKMEKEKGDWGFKALKQIVKLHFKHKNHQELLSAYKEMLTYVSSAVTRNASEKKINSLLDHISTSRDARLLQDFYGTTLGVLADAANERLWFKVQLKLCGLWLNLREFERARRILKELHQSCQTGEGEEDVKKGTQLLEIYALEIQLHSELKNAKILQRLYKDALAVKVLGTIRECGGKFHLHERAWDAAATDFFEAFKSYDEAGSTRRLACLKYLVLASLLAGAAVDPFNAQEVAPYKQDPEILAMTNMVAAYQNNDIRSFERIVATNRRSIQDDPFIKHYIDDLLTKIQTQVLLKLIQPYQRARLEWLGRQLNTGTARVERLLVSLILDGQVAGRIDQVAQTLELEQEAAAGSGKYTALERWTTHLEKLHSSLLTSLA